MARRSSGRWAIGPRRSPDSREALTTFRDDPNAYDLLLTDQTMPHYTGTQLVAAIRLVRPGLPAIIATGFHPRVEAGPAAAFLKPRLLLKPYSIAELAKEVRDALDGARATGDAEGE